MGKPLTAGEAEAYLRDKAALLAGEFEFWTEGAEGAETGASLGGEHHE